VPTVHDVLHLPLELRGIREAGFALGARRVRIFDCGGQRSERRKWIHQFEDVGAIIFVANIGSYDEAFVGQNALENTIMWFELSIRTFGSGKAPIILLLNKVRQFEEKLPGSPLSKHFPDYVGSDDPNSARKYILERFNKVNRWRLRICPYFVELGSTSTTELISSVVADALFSNVPNNFDRELNRQ
jgi:guanine nucleotide-binding protein G(i) subunit alpha